MGLPDTVAAHLQRHHVNYDILSHPPTTTLLQAAEACELPLSRLARAVVLVDGRGLLMAILPADHVLDFDALGQQLERSLEPVPTHRLSTLFDDCENGSCPPLGAAYGLEVIIDTSLTDISSIAFEPGSHECLVQVSGNDFLQLQNGASHASFSQPVGVLGGEGSAVDRGDNAGLQQLVARFTPARVKQDIDEFHDLPSLPATAHQLLLLNNDPHADAEKLGIIIAQDPALAAQVLRYANSPLYGFTGKIKDIKSAIARVLGFDFVLNLALGISIGSSMTVPLDGPLGLNAFWRHSVHAARLTEQLALALPRENRPNPGTAYVAGLLQNIGTLALGQAFEPEFFLMNRFVLANPHLPILELEQHVLGVSHNMIGGWLMDAWGMPGELVATVRHHHDTEYGGEHASYPQLVLLANRLLKRHGIGDAEREDLPPTVLARLGLSEGQVLAITNNTLENQPALDSLAARLAA